MLQLREYQSRSISMLYDWLSNNPGHPCVVLPTGAGKSVIIAELVRQALQGWPEAKVLMLCHQKELLEQNAQKMRAIWPGAPMGVYSASIGKKQLGEPILFAGIQSIRNKAHLVGHIDVCIVDECHCISHKEEGGYRKFISDLLEINPSMRVVGYSATPYRLGHGYITDKPALFDDLIEPVSIEELIFKGHLSPLRSKVTGKKLDVSGVKKRGGEYIESELQAAVDNLDTNEAVAREIVARADGRKSWLIFCAGVDHAQHMAAALCALGVTAECVTGETPKKERARMLDGFKAGRITALTNANVLTTGFDAPDTDLIALVRPTLSPSLYVQMAGRGMRVKSHTDHCLVLDFAGCVATHGPVTAVVPPKKAGDKPGAAPTKACPECGELLPASCTVCAACGHVFEREARRFKLHDDDIMGISGTEMAISSWMWTRHVSRTSGIEMLRVTYYGAALSDIPVTEYLSVAHSGYAGDRARRTLAAVARSAQIGCLSGADTLEQAAEMLNAGTPPSSIEYKKDGKFYRVIDRSWNHEKTEGC